MLILKNSGSIRGFSAPFSCALKSVSPVFLSASFVLV
nr:MAG TPA: hypothetical protein [Bacteriophage sp.]